MVAVVVDASIVVEAFTAPGSTGQWCRETLATTSHYVPDLIYSEAGHAFTRMEPNVVRGIADTHSTLLAMPWTVVGYGAYGHKIWALRHDVSIYDASYVALAMVTGFPLVTMDRKLIAVASRHCDVMTVDEL